MFKRLTTRLVLSHLLVIAIAMTLLSFVLLSLVQGYFVQTIQQNVTNLARVTAQALESTTPTNLLPITQSSTQNALQQQSQVNVQVQNVAPNSLDNVAIRLTAELDTRVRVVDARGIVQADTANVERGRDLSRDPLIVSALNGVEQSRVQADWIFVATPLRREGRIIGAVLLGQPLRDVAVVLADLRARLIVSALVALALSAVVGAALARAIARPVRQLTRAAHQLAQGDFDYPIDARASDELGDLARAFRAMSGDLARTLQARTDLVSNVSHELRTPLTAIKGLIETLRDGAVDDLAARDKFLASIEGETNRLIRLVNDLLILSRADSHALALRRETFDLTALARDCAQELATARVAIVVEGTPTQVYADPDRIRQVLVNLLDNALRYSPPGETVNVIVEAESKNVAVSVHDRGAGIPLAEQARVFERFYRADKSRARDPQDSVGAGLGLAIAQTIVVAHGGHIALTSREGHGTTVRFTLATA
jgi:signal transduction histidine kinase